MSPHRARPGGVAAACTLALALLCAPACALALVLPGGHRRAARRAPATLRVAPLRASLGDASPSGLAPSWSLPRDVVLVDRGIAAADRIARLPYVYGGGHGSFDAAGYDCSGSVSYVLHAMGALETPADSSDLMGYGEPGPGRHVTIYSNPAHAYVVIDGRRFDTAGLRQTGTRWQTQPRSSAGYVVRHPPGL